MKMLPVQLSLNPPLGLWSDMLWRCPPAPSSQLAELKTQLPPSLPSDPRLWGREDVTVFLRFCEREFDLPKLDHDLFQMNGKALCLLTRADFGHRCPGAGDVLHNVLQMLIIESHMMQWHLPNSPVTPTSRYPLSPHSHPPTPTWPPIAPPESPFHNAHMHHFMAPNSVTLSPPPSVDSQASSPPQSQEQSAAGGAGASSNGVACSGNASNSSNSSACSSSAGGNGGGSGGGGNGGGGNASTAMSAVMGGGNAFATHHAASTASSNQSESDEESSYSEMATANGLAKSNGGMIAGAGAKYNTSPPTTPILKDMPHSLSQQITNSFVNSWSQSQQQSQHSQKFQPSNGNGGSVSAPTTPSYMQPVKREFFPESAEPNTNGRLLWDFLQQLLNDRNQKYSDLIAWKCRDTGVFKIVDPAGLAKLWGIQKNHLSMNYDKMSRALRYYYRVNILRKVQGERHCYQFLRNPTELKNIKNISLLRQTVTSAGTTGTMSGSSAGASVGNGSSNVASTSSNNSNGNNSHASNQSPSTNVSSTNWTLPHQSVNGSQQSPQRPASRSSNGGSHHNHMSLPAISTSAAAAGVAPLFMHAINGAFQYLSNSNSVPTPNSPALPSTPSEKFQFGAFKLEPNSAESADELKPTDLSVAGPSGSGNEKRPYSSPSAEDCYPLIRNADGLTTIKLIRYNDGEASAKTTQHSHEEIGNSKQNGECTVAGEVQESTPMDHTDGDASEEEVNGKYMMPTDLRK